MEKGGWLYLSFPPELKVEETAENCREEAGLLGLTCTVEAKENRIKFVPDRPVRAGEGFYIVMDKAITLPDTDVTV